MLFFIIILRFKIMVLVRKIVIAYQNQKDNRLYSKKLFIIHFYFNFKELWASFSSKYIARPFSRIIRKSLFFRSLTNYLKELNSSWLKKDAISSISRWAFIKASFPHILHACAATLVSRIENNQNQKLGNIFNFLYY